MALGAIELPASLTGERADYQLHPALFDAALQVAASLMSNTSTGTWLPVAVSELRTYRHAPPRLWSLARVVEASAKAITVDVSLFDEEGSAIADIRGLTVEPVDHKTIERHFKRQTQDLYEIALDVPETSESTTETLAETQLLGCGSVLHLLQAQIKQEQPARLWLVTRNAVGVEPMQDVTVQPPSPSSRQGLPESAGAQDGNKAWQNNGGAERSDSLAIAQAPLWGMGKVIALEHPELRCARVDLDPRAAKDAGAETLFQEARSETQEDQVAFRNNGRYVARLIPYGRGRTHNRLDAPAGKPYQLRNARRGTLDNLELVAVTRRPPQAGEVEIRVQASGLNFLDVVGTLDLLPGGSDLPLGGECAGEIVALGEGVEEFQVGDAVIAIAPSSFSQYVTTDAALVAPKPEGLGFEEAATMPVVFLAAWYALHRLAQLSAGERVLIHAAAGGVGIAAIQLAQLAGAEVFATASPPKWGVLPEKGIVTLSELTGQTQAVQVGVSPMDWPRFLKQFPAIPVFLSALTPDSLPTRESTPIKQRLEQASEEDYEGILIEFIRNGLANVLRINPAQLDVQQPLNTLGLDSLMAVELRNRIRLDLAVDIPLVRFMEGASVLDNDYLSILGMNNEIFLRDCRFLQSHHSRISCYARNDNPQNWAK